MSNFKKQLLAGPYLIWMIGFILLPLVFILYYAITAADGSFTFSNIAAIADPVHVKSILLSLKPVSYTHLPRIPTLNFSLMTLLISSSFSYDTRCGIRLRLSLPLPDHYTYLLFALFVSVSDEQVSS